MSNITFTMIKPDATGKAYTGAILDRILEAGFKIKAMKWTKLSAEKAGAFYEVHKELYNCIYLLGSVVEQPYKCSKHL